MQRQSGACAALDGATAITVRPSTPAAEPPADAGGELYPTQWVLHRLGITSRKLRSWHYRYGLDPAGRTTGGHRRYSAADVERLELMCRLIAGGVPVGEAARRSHPPSPVDGPDVSARRVERLDRAARELDQRTTTSIINEVLGASGVVAGWTDVLAPALRLRGEQFGRTADGVNVEHLLSECVRAALTALAWRSRRWLDTPPVLLAAPDGEQHTLPLYALAAALAERNHPCVVLGASVPERALADSTALLHPAAVFLWSHAADTARRPDPTAVPDHEVPALPVFVVGGPGWSGDAPGRVDTLGTALYACTAPTRPMSNGPAGPEQAEVV